MRVKKIPVTVEAWQLDHRLIMTCGLAWVENAWNRGAIDYYKRWYIETLEGTMKADDGDYLVKGVRGELYPVKGEIFWETYERL